MQRFYMPTEIITGRGCVAELENQVGRFGGHAMVVCGQSFAQASGVLDRVCDLVAKAGVSVTVYDGVLGEASLDGVEQGIALAREEHCDLFVGLGGGSAIDTAKAIAGMANLEGTVAEYHAGRSLDGPSYPLLTIPTTAGTGAEVTKNSVLIDPALGVKKSIRDDSWFAKVAFVDPEMTVSMPASVTASTGSDALCQAIESYTSIAASPVTDSLAMRAIELIGSSLLQAYEVGDDLGAREKMSMGALIAGMAMASARLGGVHGMAHPLGSRYGIPHGVVCGLLMPYTMAYNACYATAKYARIAALLGEPIRHLTPEAAAQKAVERVRSLMSQLNIPSHLADYGVSEEDFGWIIEQSLPSGSLKHNPRPLTAEDVRHLLLTAL